MKNLSTTYHDCEFITLQEINNCKSRLIQWIANGLFPKGVAVLSGKRRPGKSMFSLDLALAVSRLIRKMTGQANLRNLTGISDPTASSQNSQPEIFDNTQAKKMLQKVVKVVELIS